MINNSAETKKGNNVCRSRYGLIAPKKKKPFEIFDKGEAKDGPDADKPAGGRGICFEK